MSKLQFVLGRIEAGASIRILQDVYGQEKIVVRGAWLPVRRRISLRREEIKQVKAALHARASAAGTGDTVKI